MWRKRFTLLLFFSVTNWNGCGWFQDANWIGHYPLTLSIEAMDPQGLADAAYAVCWDEVEADAAIAAGSNSPSIFQPFLRKDGTSVSVECYGRRSKWGADLHYHQQKFLVIVSGSSDRSVDQQQFIKVEIPDGRKSRELSVQLP